MAKKPQKSSLSQALNRNVRHYGRAVVSNLSIATKTSMLFSPNHQNVIQALKDLEDFITSFIQLEGEVNLSRVDEFLFLNDVPIRVDLGGVQTYAFILDLYRDRGIGSLVFKDGIKSAELSRLVALLNKELDDAENPWDSFEQELQSQSFTHVEAFKYSGEQEEKFEFSDDRRITIINTYFRAVHIVAEALETLGDDRRLNLKRLKRIVHSMVDMALEEESTLLALVHIKDYLSRPANHAVNVAVLSVALGAKLGLPKKHLGDLGITALLHDSGKVKLPESLQLAAPDLLAEEERSRLRNHVHDGVELLLNQRIVDSIVKSMNVCFLHHFRFDGTGYPKTQVVNTQNLYSRIVAVANFYDNRGAPTPDGNGAWPADRILRGLLDGSGSEFDPLVVKAFINLVGLFPVGSIVLLDSGELATVVAASANPRYLDRPTVRVFADEAGTPTDSTLNLMERDSDGSFKRSILKLWQQQEVELEMEEYLTVI